MFDTIHYQDTEEQKKAFTSNETIENVNIKGSVSDLGKPELRAEEIMLTSAESVF